MKSMQEALDNLYNELTGNEELINANQELDAAALSGERENNLQVCFVRLFASLVENKGGKFPKTINIDLEDPDVIALLARYGVKVVMRHNEKLGAL